MTSARSVDAQATLEYKLIGVDKGVRESEFRAWCCDIWRLGKIYRSYSLLSVINGSFTVQLHIIMDDQNVYFDFVSSTFPRILYDHA